jgi:Na+-transporting NADH:ubiquinone oxidoreductase subunit F
VLALVVLILGARAVLVPQGEVSINVNGERDIITGAGVKLLYRIFQPSIRLNRWQSLKSA